MPADYYRIELRVTPEVSRKLEQLQKEVFEETGKKKTKAYLVREMVADFFKIPSSSCIPKRKKS